MLFLLQGRLSKAADTYAFGVLLWEMYTGQRPWAGMLQMQVPLAAVVSGISFALADANQVFKRSTALSPIDLLCGADHIQHNGAEKAAGVPCRHTSSVPGIGTLPCHQHAY